jgi:hypothetical protein
VNVLVTIALIAGVAMWAAAVYARLVRLRQQVADAWKLLQVDQSKTAAQNVYNARVQSYNAALDTFPAYLIAPLAGLKPAKQFK